MDKDYKIQDYVAEQDT
jgi:hypothetical protein